MMRRFAILFLLATSGLFFVSCTKKTPSLNLLVWEGYADPSYVRGFEEQCQCKVSASYMGSSDELVAKLRGGSAGNYDVISPSSDVATSIAAAGLAAPLDLAKLPGYGQLSPQLTSLPLVKINGQVYGVPFMWGAQSSDLRHHSLSATARELDRSLGSEISRQNLGLGRSLHPLHGGATVGIRQARSQPTLRSER